MKKILSRAAIKRIDELTIKSGTTPSQLVRNAAQAFIEVFLQFYAKQQVVIVCGTGNNGADGLEIARILKRKSIPVSVYYLDGATHSPEFDRSFSDLQQKLDVKTIHKIDDLPILTGRSLIIDALFGTGLNRPLTEPSIGVVDWINQQDAVVVSVDVPSGMIEQPRDVPDIMVAADYVIAFEIPRLDLLLQRDGYNPIRLNFESIGLSENAINDEPSNYYLVEESDIKKLLLPRKLFDNKWSYGHALIVAGTRPAMGAAMLATGAALRSGCGLVTAHIPKSGATTLNTLFPEAMLSADMHDEMITEVALLPKFASIGIGCGIGRSSETMMALVDVLTKSKLPIVIDADAISLLGEHHAWKTLIRPGTVLTPHQKEFDRLAGNHANEHARLSTQIQLARELECVIIIKGAFTRIALPNGKCFFNSTGTPALGTAGTGDVLTGLIAGLLARGYSPEDAAILGVYLHGKSAQAASSKMGIESMTAMDIINYVSGSLNELYQ